MNDMRPCARSALLGAVALASCGRPAETPDARASSRSYVLPGVTRVGPGRWFPVASPDDARVSELEPDGSVLSIEHGLRIVRHPDARIERATETFPDGGAVVVLRLPPRFGGGFLFRATLDGATSLYGARSFTGSLVPLVRLPFEAADVVLGVDRLIATSSRTRAAVGIDPLTGDVSGGVGALPASAGYGGIAGRDGWMLAVETDVRGVLVTFDAGESYRPLGVVTTSPGVLSQGSRILIGTPKGARELLPSGELRDLESPTLDAMFQAVDASSGDEVLPEDQQALTESSLEGEPLELAARYGIPDTPSSAVVTHAGSLTRVSLEDGRVLGTTAHVTPESAVCEGIRLGKGIGFVCGQTGGGGTTIFALGTPLALTPVLELDGPRRVLPNGLGAIAITGGCSPGPASTHRYCIVSASGERVDVDVRGDPRVAALSSGAVAMLAPPGSGEPGKITVRDRGGQERSARLVLSGLGKPARDLLSHGLWLDGLIEVEPGVLSGWVFGGSSFAGVRVKLDGTVVAGSLKSTPEGAIVSGRFALLRGDGGSAAETIDGGMTWSDLVLPDVAEPSELEGARGCTEVGCSAGSFVRIGWGASGKDLSPAAQPPDARLDLKRFVSWSFECAPTGVTDSARAIVSRPPSRGGKPGARALPVPALRDASALDSSAFRPFLGLPAPERAEGDLGFDFGTEDHVVQVRGYAFGPRDAAWDRAGSWVVRGVDRFAASRAIWSTAVSRPPWADARAAAEVFGSDPSHRVINEWGAVLDPGNEGGLLFMKTGTRTDLAVVERDRAIVFVRNADEFALERPAGAVKVGGRYYLGLAPSPRTFQVLSIDNGLLTQLASFPRVVEDAPARLVRSRRGDALGLWVTAHGQSGTRAGGDTWLIYPVDPEKGEAFPPLVVSRDATAHAPAPCDPEQDGWVLLHDISPSVGKVVMSGGSEGPAMHRLEARLIAGPHGVCLDALAAQVDGEAPRSFVSRSLPSRSRSVGLALTDRATDRRFGFRCAP